MLYRRKLIFNSLAVNPSLDKGYINHHNMRLSGDDSSLHISKHDVPTSIEAFAYPLYLNESIYLKYVCLDSADDAITIITL